MVWLMRCVGVMVVVVAVLVGVVRCDATPGLLKLPRPKTHHVIHQVSQSVSQKQVAIFQHTITRNYMVICICIVKINYYRDVRTT